MKNVEIIMIIEVATSYDEYRIVYVKPLELYLDTHEMLHALIAKVHNSSLMIRYA